MEIFRKMLFAGLSILAFSFLAVNANAQSGATVDPVTKQITLDEAKPLAAAYNIDLRGLNLQNDAQAQAFFAKYATKYISFTFDLNNKLAVMELKGHMIADKPLTVAQWNKILLQLNK